MTNVESDFEPNASLTWSFENDLEGWVVTSGTFNRQPGGAQGTGFHLSSSQCLDDQCDIVRSPVVRLQPTSQLSLFHRYDTETPVPIPYDRANVGVWTWSSGPATTVSPRRREAVRSPRKPAQRSLRDGEPGRLVRRHRP